MTFFNYLTVISAVIAIILILLQTRGAGLGAGLGGGGEVNTVRRGSDQTVHQITIIMVIVFCASLILSVIV
jgi:protein translocase SecG subunit